MDAAKKPRIINSIADLGLKVPETGNDTLSHAITEKTIDAFVELYKLKGICSVLGMVTIDETRLEPDIALEVLNDNLETAREIKQRLGQVCRILDDVRLNLNHFEQFNSRRRDYVKRRQADAQRENPLD